MLDHDATAAFLDLSADALNADALVFTTPFQFHKRGVETRLVIGVADARAIDATLLRNIARAHRCYGMMRLGETLEAICASENVSRHRMLQIIDLAFLSPDIVRAMALGDQPLRLTTKWLEKTRCHPTGKRSGRSPRSCAHRDPCTPEASRFFCIFISFRSFSSRNLLIFLQNPLTFVALLPHSRPQGRRLDHHN